MISLVLHLSRHLASMSAFITAGISDQLWQITERMFYLISPSDSNLVLWRLLDLGWEVWEGDKTVLGGYNCWTVISCRSTTCMTCNPWWRFPAAHKGPQECLGDPAQVKQDWMEWGCGDGGNWGQEDLRCTAAVQLVRRLWGLWWLVGWLAGCGGCSCWESCLWDLYEVFCAAWGGNGCVLW